MPWALEIWEGYAVQHCTAFVRPPARPPVTGRLAWSWRQGVRGVKVEEGGKRRVGGGRCCWLQGAACSPTAGMSLAMAHTQAAEGTSEGLGVRLGDLGCDSSLPLDPCPTSAMAPAHGPMS